MKEEILKQRDCIGFIYSTLMEIEDFLVGHITSEQGDCVKEDGFIDLVKNNTLSLEGAAVKIKEIRKEIIGGE